MSSLGITLFVLFNCIFFAIIIAKIVASKHTPMEDPAITRTCSRRLLFVDDSMMVGGPELVTDTVVEALAPFSVEASKLIKVKSTFNI